MFRRLTLVAALAVLAPTASGCATLYFGSGPRFPVFPPGSWGLGPWYGSTTWTPRPKPVVEAAVIASATSPDRGTRVELTKVDGLTLTLAFSLSEWSATDESWQVVTTGRLSVSDPQPIPLAFDGGKHFVVLDRKVGLAVYGRDGALVARRSAAALLGPGLVASEAWTSRLEGLTLVSPDELELHFEGRDVSIDLASGELRSR
jgi:hypothetical protein